MKKIYILSLIIASICGYGSVSQTYADAVQKISSGIKEQEYKVEWCSPHVSGSPCKIGYFQNVGGVATIDYEGATFAVKSMTPRIFTNGLDTSGTDGATSVKSFFAENTDGRLNMQGEGVITIQATMKDYADNVSFFTVRYKIDKTAPQLTFDPVSMTESNATTHYEGTVDISMDITKKDSIATISTANATDTNAFPNPLRNSYIGDEAIPRTNHARNNLPAFYFKDFDGLTSRLNALHSDSYFNYLTANASSPFPDGYSGPIISDEKEFKLIAGNAEIATLGLSITNFKNTDLLNNIAENSQSKYKLRLYDKTVDKNGDSGNYSETAFYVVRDNTLPNMGANGLATTKTGAIEQILKFDTTTTAWDTTTASPVYEPETTGMVSKFIAANDSQPLISSLSDIGIGPNATSPDLYNAGLDKASLMVQIENAGTIGTYDTVFTYPNRFTNNIAKTKDFSNTELGRTNGYRKYATKMSSNGALTGICDLVGNCLKPQLSFRVAADVISDTKSAVSITQKTQKVASGKIFANGLDSYLISYTIKDKYGNKVVPVKSQENSGSPEIKTVNSITNFHNGLYADQRLNDPAKGGGNKLAVANDLETDNVPTNTGAINNTNSLIDMRELVNSGSPKIDDGRYSLEIMSKVPTKGFYPYISASGGINVSSIETTANVTAAGNITYPATGSRMGHFIAEKSSAGNMTATKFINPNTGNLGEIGSFTGFTFNKGTYGDITLNSATDVPFSGLTARYVGFEFASPFVYGLENMTMGSLTNNTFVEHTKKLYTLSGAFNAFNPTVYEKILVAYTNTNGKDGQPGILDFRMRPVGSTGSGAIINPGVCYKGGSCDAMFLTGSTPAVSPVSNNLPITESTKVEVIMSPIAALVPYTDANLHRGFASAISYSLDGNIIKLPSVARDINTASNTYLDQFDMARYYFSDEYSLGYSSARVQDTAKVITDIAITGLSNRYNGVTTSTEGTKANVDIGAELNRYSLVTSIKKNVSLLSAGFKASTETTGKRWCTPQTINQNFINNVGPAVNDCTQTINGEVISFIDGNSTLDCGSVCTVGNKRSIIVKNGSLYVKSNITTYNGGAKENGQLFLGVMNESGLANITIDPLSPNITDANKKGWLFVDPSITNIDAFLFAQGPMVSYSNDVTANELYTKSSLKSNLQLRNQLHIMGSLLTLNKIGESQNVKCPYIVANCTEEIAPIFDLINFRNFKFTSLSTYTGNPADNLKLSPFFPGPINNQAKTSGGKPEVEEPSGTGPVTCGTTNGPNTNGGLSNLRCISDRDYRPYPMLIERDIRWNSNPSEFFKLKN